MEHASFSLFFLRTNTILFLFGGHPARHSQCRGFPELSFSLLEKVQTRPLVVNADFFFFQFSLSFGELLRAAIFHQ